MMLGKLQQEINSGRLSGGVYAGTSEEATAAIPTAVYLQS